MKRIIEIYTFSLIFCLLFFNVQAQRVEVDSLKCKTSVVREIYEEIDETELNEFTWYGVWDSVLMDVRYLKGEKLDPGKMNAAEMIELLNRYDQIYIEFLKSSHDTIFITVKNEESLTEQMGTCGADEYLGMIVLTLTEIEGIEQVHLAFQQGSYSRPGTYNREYFLKR